MKQRTNKAFELPGLVSISFDKAKDELVIRLDASSVGDVNKRGFAAVCGSQYGTADLDGIIPDTVEKATGKAGSWRLKLSVYADTRTAEDKSMAKAKKSGEAAVMELG